MSIPEIIFLIAFSPLIIFLAIVFVMLACFVFCLPWAITIDLIRVHIFKKKSLWLYK